ncbi:MAG: glycosyltransferase family 2 protein [Candidatus Omnitrophica bacterium]|nr:glycosyltransferase family 2 protein [Candidatus Omnitrophota bacterium]
MKVYVIVPAYNEAKGIANVVKSIKELGLNVLVIDDGSIDHTAEIAKNSGADVLRNEINRGKGASLIAGFHYVLSGDFDAVITMDADGQHSPLDLPYFLQFAQEKNADIIIGNRMTKVKSMPFLRLATNKFMSWLISKIAKQKIPDTQCGFRFIKCSALKEMDLKTTKYEIESEVLIKASRLGLRIDSIPIMTIYHGEKSRINPIVDTFRFFKFIVRELLTTPQQNK